jgi:hypothetical protein
VNRGAAVGIGKNLLPAGSGGLQRERALWFRLVDWVDGAVQVCRSDTLTNKDFVLFRIAFPFNAKLDRNFRKIQRNLRKI